MPTIRRTAVRAGVHSLARGTSILTASLWIGIGAAAPELIWRGLQLAAADVSWNTVLGALLIGLFLAFFVEPLLERVRTRLRGERAHDGPGTGRSRGVLFKALLGVTFAIASVCLHDAMSAYVAAGHGHDSGPNVGLDLTVDWALVPFAVAMAWLTAGRGPVAAVTFALAAASAGIAGWLFHWSLQEVVRTTLPAVIILGLGYRGVASDRRRETFSSCAATVARVGTAWLLAALLVDATLPAFGLERFTLYSRPDLWIDARFYAGWVLGLVLAPVPAPAPARASPAVPRERIEP